MPFVVIGILLIFAIVYLAWRLGDVVSLFANHRHCRSVKWLTIGAILLLSVCMLFGLVSEVRFFSVVGSIWMGIALNFLLVLVSCDFIVAVIYLFVKGEKRIVIQTVKTCAVILIPILLSVYGFMNAATVTKTEYELTIDYAKEDLKIVMLSDMHLGAVGSESNLEDWIEVINEEEADLVLISGDLIDSDFHKIQNPDRAAELLRSIRSRYGVYACLGNHDAGSTFLDMLSFFEKSNITILSEQYTVINDKWVVAGRHDISPIGAEYIEGRRQDTAFFLSEIPDSNLPVLVMDHNPSDILSYDSRVDLILSGHTHKGQVFPAGFITDMIYTVDYGLFQRSERDPYVIVSSGVYGWGMPMKTSGLSEIVVIQVSSNTK